MCDEGETLNAMLAKAFDVSVSPPSPVPPQSPSAPPSTPMHRMGPMHPSYTPTQQAAQHRITSAAAPPAKRRLSINTSATLPLTTKSKRTTQEYEEHTRKPKRQRTAARRAPILSRYNRHLAVLKHRRMGCPTHSDLKTLKLVPSSIEHGEGISISQYSLVIAHARDG
jgi:hypothetical protein